MAYPCASNKALTASVALIFLLGMLGNGAAVAAPRLNTNTPAGAYAAWSSAIAATHATTQREVMGDGTTEFMACFEGRSPGCKLLMFGDRDDMRGLTHFTPGGTKLSKSTYLRIYVALKDCALPVVLLKPYYFSKNSWLFIRNLRVLADGRLVINRDFAPTSVDRQNETYGVEESVDLIASPGDLAGLRSIAQAKSVVVRFTGDSSFATVEASRSKFSIQDAAEVVGVYDKLVAASANSAKCSQSATPAP